MGMIVGTDKRMGKYEREWAAARSGRYYNL
jgi:hypothetical protein